MPCCAAVNCSNRGENYRMFSFPRNAERNSKWVQNMRRSNWTPTSYTRLCEIHFEDSQFEQNRKDGWRKLKPNAIPTLFNIPNPPPMINPRPRKSVYKKNYANESGSNSTDVESPIVQLQNLTDGVEEICIVEPDILFFQEAVDSSVPLPGTEVCLECQNLRDLLKKEREQFLQKSKQNDLEYQKSKELMQETMEERLNKIQEQEMKIKQLTEELNKIRNSQASFLNEAQIQKIGQGAVREWSNEAIIKGLKLRFALSIAGYNYLLKSGYPSPSYSTLMRRIQFKT